MSAHVDEIKHPDIPVSEVIDNNKFTIYLRNDLIVYVLIKQNNFFDVPDVTEVLASIKKVSKGNVFPLIAIYETNIGFSKKAKDIVANHHLTTADALVTLDNWPIRVLANFYLKVNKPVRPTRIFGEVNTALDWLKLNRG